ATALPHCDRAVAGMGLYRRAAGAAERLSGRGLATLEKEEGRTARRDVLNCVSLARRDIAILVPRAQCGTKYCTAEPGPTRRGDRSVGPGSAKRHFAPH